MATNEAVVTQWYHEVLNEGRLDLVPALFTPDYQNHDTFAPGGWPQGLEAVYALVHTYRTASADIHYTIEDQVAVGDSVVTRWTARGTHTGSFLGAPASGKSYTITGIGIERLVNGKIAETWINWDSLALLIQLGLVPAPAMA